MRQRKVESDYQIVKISVSLKSKIDRNCQQRAAEITWPFRIQILGIYNRLAAVLQNVRKTWRLSPKVLDQIR